jgi:hypothetical protein
MMPVRLGGITSKRSKTIRTKSWSEAAGIIENILGSRYMLGAQVGDSIAVKYVKEEWDGQPQHHYKITVTNMDPKCASCGSAPAECICDNPVV